MENYFVLELDKMVTKLAGNPLGREIYNTQVKGKVDFTKNIIIEFPDRIDTIASSFIQGFFEDMLKNLGVMGIEKKVEVKSNIRDLKEIIMDNLI